MLNELFAFRWVTLHGLVVLLGLAAYVIASHTLKQRRHPSAAIAWVVSLILLPYLALPLYLMLGNRKVVARRPALIEPASADAAATKSGQLAAAMGLPGIVTFEQLAIHQDGGQALQCLRNMIAVATQTLDLCSFLFGRDLLGDEIALLLMRRSREGLRIRLLVDGIGFYMGGHPNLKRLSAAGVQVALFVSPFKSPLPGRTNLRNHRKMVVADGAWLWCGGRNLAAEYFEGDPASLNRKRPWIDLSFDLRGALAQQAQDRFDQDWNFATRGSIATTRILLVTPYFVPDPTLLMALTLAARRGVAVDLLLPARSNHHLADIARHAALRELAEAGARVWLAPHMIHAKAMLVDDDLALIGSANLDERSLFLNYELMVAFYDASVVQGFALWIEGQKSGATRYLPHAPGLARELVEGMVRWVAFQL